MESLFSIMFAAGIALLIALLLDVYLFTRVMRGFADKAQGFKAEVRATKCPTARYKLMQEQLVEIKRIRDYLHSREHQISRLPLGMLYMYLTRQGAFAKCPHSSLHL